MEKQSLDIIRLLQEKGLAVIFDESWNLRNFVRYNLTEESKSYNYNGRNTSILI